MICSYITTLQRSIYKIHNLFFILNILFTPIPTWENFELTRWLYLNYFGYLVGLHQIKNYQQLQRFTHRKNAILK